MNIPIVHLLVHTYLPLEASNLLVQRSTLSLPSSNQSRLCTFAMRAFLVATLVLVASVITPSLSAPLRYAVVPFKLKRKIID